MRVRPDDEVFRVHAVWLGPKGMTWPWTARYLAYAAWLVIFSLVILVKAVTPLTVGLPPVWEFVTATLLTAFLTGLIDYERLTRSLLRTFRADLTAPRPKQPTTRGRMYGPRRVNERTTTEETQ